MSRKIRSVVVLEGGYSRKDLEKEINEEIRKKAKIGICVLQISITSGSLHDGGLAAAILFEKK